MWMDLIGSLTKLTKERRVVHWRFAASQLYFVSGASFLIYREEECERICESVRHWLSGEKDALDEQGRVGTETKKIH